ncbi:MAG TPA: TolC family protein [Bryobacteraceae bacterium]|jgi:outer membrane protein|nr:TolC family protein [Bryobacteraceae bacterium]
MNQISIKKISAVLLCWLLLAPAGFSAPADNPAKVFNWLKQPYVEHPIAPVDLSNSPRIRQLLRSGNIYLSMPDAIALAIENNLDIQLERYTLPSADTEVLRAKGGGLLRGLTYNVFEVPVGVGGPASPLVTSAATPTVGAAGSVPTNPSELGALSEQLDNLSMLQTVPISTGPAIPQFDPTLTGQLNWTHATTPDTSPASNGAPALSGNTTTANAAYTQGFGPGTELSAGFDNARYTTNSLQSAFSPYTASSLGFTVTQPLLRGFGLAVNRRFIRISKNEQKIANLLVQQQLIATVYGVVRLYTDLVALYEDVKVKEETLASAQKLYTDTKAEVDEGTQAPVELTRANAQVFTIRQDLIDSRGLLEEQEAIVKNVITRRTDNDPDILNARIIPTDTIEVPGSDETKPLQDLVALAFANRPDLSQAGLQVQNTQISLQGSRNGLRPELDIVGVAQNSALAAQPNPLVPAIESPLIGGYGNALEQLATRKYPTYGIGLNLTLPLRNRIAQADVTRDEILLRQSQVIQAQLQKQAQLEVEDALIAMRRARASYEAATETEKLQQESLDTEQAKFEVGASTSFFIIQYQSFLAQAKSTVVVAQSAYLKARAALERATGTILDDNHVSLGDAIRGR